jgi:hypothetical protein
MSNYILTDLYFFRGLELFLHIIPILLSVGGLKLFLHIIPILLSVGGLKLFLSNSAHPPFCERTETISL